MISVLFVCLGNICRSPMAEAVFRHLVQEAGLTDRIRVDSAGTGDWHIGEAPHHGTRQKLSEQGISFAGIKARQVKRQDLSDFTYVIGMDDSNLANLRKLAPDNTVTLTRFVDLVPHTTYTEVPDPWYTGNFDETYQLVNEGCQALLEKIRREHSL